MPSYVCSFEKDGRRWFFMHSTIVDAPTTCALTEEEFIAHYLSRSELKEQHARAELRPRLERAIRHGSSCFNDDSLADAITCNRAGPKESRLTVEQYIAYLLSERTRLGYPEPRP